MLKPNNHLFQRELTTQFCATSECRLWTTEISVTNVESPPGLWESLQHIHCGGEKKFTEKLLSRLCVELDISLRACGKGD